MYIISPATKAWVLFALLTASVSVYGQIAPYSNLGPAQPVVIDGRPVTRESGIEDITVKIKVQTSKGSKNCTGTLIDHDIVVTAGHCFKELPEAPQVPDITVQIQGQGAGEYGVFQYEVSPGYRTEVITDGYVRAKFAYNDIAILRLKNKISMRVRPALLAEENFKPFSEQEFLIAGYGLHDRFTPRAGGSLLFTEVKISEYQDNAKVESVYRLRDGSHCKGDSGGPVFLEKDNRLILVGVNTWGDCSSVSRAEIVAHHLHWIREASARLQSYQDL